MIWNFELIWNYFKALPFDELGLWESFVFSLQLPDQSSHIVGDKWEVDHDWEHLDLLNFWEKFKEDWDSWNPLFFLYFWLFLSKLMKNQFLI